MNLAVKFSILLGVLLLPCFLSGQQNPGSLGPPTLGFLFDAGSHALRPLVGIPGASLLGAPLKTGPELVDVAISPRQNYFLAVADDSRQLKLLQLSPGGFSATSVDGALLAADRIFFSPTGTAAAVYRSTDGILQIISGLPSSPLVRGEIPLAGATSPLISAAVADDGDVALVATASGESGSLFLVVASSGTLRPIPVSGPVSAVAFRSQTHDAIAASSSQNQIFLLQNVTGDGQFQIIASADEGISKPIAVEFSNDGRKAFVANSDAGKIIMLDISGGQSLSISCGCTPTGLYRLNGNAVFRLTDSFQDPLLLFDGDASPPRIVFVPPDSTQKHPQGGDQ
jgi:WD40 repeat protein